jgi:DNA-directed RNA polymerase subunit RPC12/RpoP
LKEKYEHMTEGEIDALAEEAYDLTEIAREALQAVIKEKVITVRLALKPPLLRDEDDLVIFRWPRSYEEIGYTIKILAAAAIPYFICLQVRGVDLRRAEAVMKRAIDEEFEEENDDPEDQKDYAIVCPKCRSAKVVLKGRDTGLAAPRSRRSFDGDAMPAVIGGWTMA